MVTSVTKRRSEALFWTLVSEYGKFHVAKVIRDYDTHLYVNWSYRTNGKQVRFGQCYGRYSTEELAQEAKRRFDEIQEKYAQRIKEIESKLNEVRSQQVADIDVVWQELSDLESPHVGKCYTDETVPSDD